MKFNIFNPPEDLLADGLLASSAPSAPAMVLTAAPFHCAFGCMGLS